MCTPADADADAEADAGSDADADVVSDSVSVVGIWCFFFKRRMTAGC